MHISRGLLSISIVLTVVTTEGCSGGPSSPSSSASVRVRCAQKLRELDQVLMAWAEKSRGQYYPELCSVPGSLIMSNKNACSDYPLYPGVIRDISWLFCTNNKNRIPAQIPADLALLPHDRTYVYLGYALKNDEDVRAFATAYKERIAAHARFDEDLRVPMSGDSASKTVIQRLRMGMAERTQATASRNLEIIAEETRQMSAEQMRKPPAPPPESRRWTNSFAQQVQSELTEATSNIPLIIELPDNHLPKGGNVLFLDGIVQFMSFPGEWPMTEVTISALRELIDMSLGTAK